MLNGGASSWDEAAKHASMQPLQVATWNLDALKTFVDVAAALDFDILALQELRVDQCADAGIQAKVKKVGFHTSCWLPSTVYWEGQKGST